MIQRDLDCGKARPGGWFRRRASDESGQALVITAISMVMLLVCAGLVLDIGHAMLVQRQLQAGVDAAALAGAQHLPDAPAAEAVAVQYSATPGRKNAVNTVDNATTTARVSCLAGVPGCNRRDGGVNGIVVRSTSSVPTWFGRVIGINTLKVSAMATACSPCSVKPLDIMVVLDRTGSMCQFGPNSWDANCTDLNNARQGIRTFLSMLDPSLDKVGLALTPPALSRNWISSCPSQGYSGGDGPTRPWYKPWNGTTNPNVPSGHPDRGVNGRYYGYGAYWPYYDLSSSQGSDPSRYVVASLEGADGQSVDDYLVQDQQGNWVLNDAQSAVLQRLGCTSGAGTTSYALSLEEAQYELSRNGRGSVQDVIIFLSDGAANTSPMNVPNNHWTNNPSNVRRPCGTGVQSAQRIKNTGTVIYTIGYDLDAGGSAPERCREANTTNGQPTNNPEQCGTWGCTAFDAIQAMATDRDGPGGQPPLFYNKPNPGDLTQIFTAIAQDLAGSRGRLIDNTSPNLP